MTATPFDSTYLHSLFPTGDSARLFSDTAEVRAMMLVEGTLAQVQGAAGVIPEVSAQAIHRASLELQLDPSGLAEATAQNGVAIPALVSSFRSAMQAPEHAQYLHWGATSQDIQDSGLMLRLRQILSHQEERLKATLKALARLAEDNAETPMAARTYGQHATPTAFGAQVASWGWPLLQALQDLEGVREYLWVSLSGAAGTGSVLGPDPIALRADLAEKLGLKDPGHSWHSDRTPILKIAGWLARLSLANGKMGEDLILLSQSGISEVRLGGSGASSTMPQKQNPVAPSVLKALALHTQGLHATLEGASLHRQQRDGAAWFTEWLTLPQLVLASCASMTHAQTLAESLQPDTKAMMDTLEATGGMVMAEALSFKLAETMPRPEAQAEAKTLATRARSEGKSLSEVTYAAYPELDPAMFDPTSAMGSAPTEARAFAKAVTEQMNA
jgi:3-carboxy-cis,cis-muconate cycloisomerase